MPWTALAIGLSGLATAGSAAANYAASNKSLKEAQKSRQDAQAQLQLENQRYDENIKRQDAFQNEVNASASLFDSPQKKKDIMPMDKL